MLNVIQNPKFEGIDTREDNDWNLGILNGGIREASKTNRNKPNQKSQMGLKGKASLKG